mmetsp:Transcript_4003/g.5586  ORF Transcript_4003/g.5586 Transcript_4003/m.5586 type:complete len:270 (-) Transcript_4003:605-1414(-)
MNNTADETSAPRVASAAPVTPMPALKMRNGSKTAFIRFAKRLIFNGVTVSITPRKALNPIREKREGRNAKPRMRRYGLANSRAGAPSFRTPESKLSGRVKTTALPTTAMKNPTINAWLMASCTPSSSPLAFSLATNVAVILGKKLVNQKAELKIWLAAACPATARVLPMRLIQNRSTAPTRGLIAKLAIHGRAILMRRLSRLSMQGHALISPLVTGAETLVVVVVVTSTVGVSSSSVVMVSEMVSLSPSSFRLSAMIFSVYSSTTSSLY